MQELSNMKPSEIRMLIRQNQLTCPTAGMVNGYTQANLVVLKKDLAFEFLLFCQRNPKPCPVLDVTEPGLPIPKLVAPEADLRTDLPKYCIYKHGQLEDEVTDILNYWEDDMVAFLLGCSFTFEQALANNGIPVRHIEEGRNVAMYKTNIPCVGRAI